MELIILFVNFIEAKYHLFYGCLSGWNEFTDASAEVFLYTK